MSLAVRPLPAVLAVVATVLLLPQAAAGPLDGPIETNGPPLPDAVDPDDLVQIHHPDVDVDEDGAKLQLGDLLLVQAGCTAGIQIDAMQCSGNVCFFNQGSGDLPVWFDHGHGMIGVGVDLGIVASESESAAAEEGGEYGPYQGVAYSDGGQCGP